MDQSFIEVLQKIVKKHGKGPLLDPEKCRAFVADYAKRDYKQESCLLLKAVEAGVSRAILASSFNDLTACMNQQHKKLQDELGFDPAESIYVVNILAQILWRVSFNGK